MESNRIPPCGHVCTQRKVVAFSSQTTRAEAWVRRRDAPDSEVNNEDDHLGVMCDLMENLVESIRLGEDLQYTNDELQTGWCGLRDHIRKLELNRFRGC